MKKSILAVLLAVALITPAFAATSAKKNEKTVSKQETKKETKFDIVGKLGLSVVSNYNSSFCWSPDENTYEGNSSNAFAIAIEGYYKLDEKLSVGLGLSYGFESELSSPYDATYFPYEDKAKLGFTNIYLSVKPSLSESIYAIGQIGYGISHGSFYDDLNMYGNVLKVDGGGLYFGLGAGVEYKSFLFEVLYSINTATFKEKNYVSSEGTDYVFKYSSLNVNVGYKFSL